MERPRQPQKTIDIRAICKEGSVDHILERLDKAHAVNKSNQLDLDLADSLDYCWRKQFTLQHFMPGFHTRFDKISSLKLENNLKGHLLLRQAHLTDSEQDVVVEEASDLYDVQNINTALQNI